MTEEKRVDPDQGSEISQSSASAHTEQIADGSSGALSRRALIRAGWSLPLVMAAVPARASCSPVFGTFPDSHDDGGGQHDDFHDDAFVCPHEDGHSDTTFSDV